MPSLSLKVTHGSDQERRILQEMRRRVKMWEHGTSTKREKWREAEDRVLAYLPERDVDAARRSARNGGLPQYTTIQIPYTYAVVMSAFTYISSVFMSRSPVFQVNGRHGESQQQVQAMEALLDYQLQVGGMLPYLYTWIYDSLRYGVSVKGIWWDERIEVVSTIEEFEQEDEITGLPTKTERLRLSQPMRTYAGNKSYNLEPQSFIWDTRVTMREFQAGEFTGEKRKVPWNEIVRGAKRGFFVNLEHIGTKGSWDSYTVADEGSPQLERPDVYTQNEYGTGNAPHPMNAELYRLCVEVIPDEWGLGSSDYPEKWVFTCTSDWRTLVGACPLGAFHSKHPYAVIPLEPEGYGLTTRGLPEVLEPVQNTIDWLVNSHFWNVRASLNDRWVVDPQRVVMKDLLTPEPGKVIRLRPEAYGTDPKLAIAQFPASNVTQSFITNDLPMMVGLGERTGGVNDQIMGMLSTGGRKTATEVRTSTSFGINRLKTISEFSSACGWTPFVQMMIQNSQQYYDMEMKLRIAGDTAMNAGMNFIMTSPDAIAGAYDFIPVDGTLPIDRYAQVQLWEQLMQAGMANPQIGMGYDWAGIFQWIAQLAGLKNITQFRVQVTPDDVLAQQMAAGNSVPLGGGGAPKKPNGNAAGAQSAPGMSGAPA